MQMSFIGMFDLWTPAVPGEFPWPILWIGCCERPHVPLLQSRQAQYTPPPLKGLAIELSGKWQYLLTWNTHILPIGVGVGSGTGEGPLDAAVARRKSRPGSFVAGGGWGLCWRGAVLQRWPYCVLKKRQGLYLFETAGGWWGANLLSGCVVGPLFPIAC